VSDVDNELRELLQERAGSVRIDASIPTHTLRRSRRRRIATTLVTGAVTVGVVAGAFVGAQALLNDGSTTSRHIPGGRPATSEIWLTMHHHLFVTTAETTGTPEAAVRALLDGPTDEQSGATVSSAIPAGTELTDLSVQDGLARTTFSTHVESDPLSDAQVVYTLTQFPEIQRVLVNDQEGGPLGRADLEGQLPAILLEQPEIGDVITSPVTISGTANVFEATVSIRIIAGEGSLLADTSTTASCGTGCRGQYSESVPFTVDHRQPGTIMVFESSAETGQPTNVVRIPVTLEPSSTGQPTEWDGVWRPDYTNAGTEAGADPRTAALAFASDILSWDPARVHVEERNPGPNPEMDLWSLDMTTSFPRDLATVLVMKQVGTEWTVWHAESGLFDVTCPSPRADVLETGATDGSITPTEICGAFTTPPAGWIVKGTVEYADSSLQPSEAQATADIPVNGRDFHGFVPLTASYGGADVAVMIRVYSGSGATVGVWARRYVSGAG
jgi:hypothetical protein